MSYNIFDNSRQHSDLKLKPCSQENFHEFCYSELQKILKKEFPSEPNKQIIKRQIDEFDFACPFCGDSATNSTRKRGGFIFKKGAFFNMFKCFNCGKYMSIKSFFRHFNVSIPNNVNDYMIKNKPDVTESRAIDGKMIDTLLGRDEVRKLSISVSWMCEKYGFEKISRNSPNPGYYYMIGRNQYSFSHFLYDRKTESMIIMNLLDANRCIGFQIRPLNVISGGPKYITVSLQKMHDKMLFDDVKVPQRTETLSKIFGIFEINLNFPVLVTEGPLDSLLLPNSIALLGAAKNIPLDIPLYFVYDSDKTGISHAVRELRNGNHVFLWEKLKKDMKLPERKKWDINDVVNYCISKNMRIPLWTEYFTDDILDIMNV